MYKGKGKITRQRQTSLSEKKYHLLPLFLVCSVFLIQFADGQNFYESSRGLLVILLNPYAYLMFAIVQTGSRDVCGWSTYRQGLTKFLVFVVFYFSLLDFAVNISGYKNYRSLYLSFCIYFRLLGIIRVLSWFVVKNYSATSSSLLLRLIFPQD